MSIARSALRIEVPEKLVPLLQPARYKGAHGGRGGAKSHFFAQLAVAKAYAQAGTRIVCIREVQNTIKDSVKHLIESKIRRMGLGDVFEPMASEIRTRGGGLIVFKGMQDYNADNIKSLEDFDVAWIEEAQNLSARSLRLLRPTIRKPGSEIWASWNPRWDTDPIDEFFRGPHKPDGAVCIEVNWQDNPWFPDVLRDEMERDRLADPDMASHVWDGGYEVVSEGAYYAKLLAAAEKQGRFGNFAYRAGQKVQTSWDLGIRDHNPIWFIVEDMEYATVVDYYEVSGEGFDHIVATALPELFIPPKLNPDFAHWSKEKALEDFSRPVPFEYKQHWLPHDVAVREQANGGRARYQTLMELGLKTIRKGSSTSPEDRVNAVRQVIPRLRFNTENPRVVRGIKRLRQYKRKFNDRTGEYEGPLHDEASHAADALGEYAINCPWYVAKVQEKPAPLPTRIEVTEIQPGMVRSNIDASERKLKPKEFIDMIKKSRAANG